MNEELRPKRVVVCLFAHNEEKCIRQTVLSLLEGNPGLSLCIKVYLNGCTDRSLEIVEELAGIYPCVEPVVIAEASKVAAWNQAFSENTEEILFFGDGDVTTEKGAISGMLAIFAEEKNIELACCTTSPMSKGLLWQQQVIGLLQIPLQQDFLTGHFYALRRERFVAHFSRFGLAGIPAGIVGDDAFLDRLVTRNNFKLIKNRVFYKPPVFVDYIRYISRLRWQNEQIDRFFSEVGVKDGLPEEGGGQRFIRKMQHSGSPVRFFLGAVMTVLRTLFKLIFAQKIEAAYQRLGPVVDDGAWILSKATRSDSVK